MEYFDKQALDNRGTEWIAELLDFYQGIVSDTAVLKKYRTFYSEVMQELLDYYWDRIEEEAKEKEDDAEDDLPF